MRAALLGYKVFERIKRKSFLLPWTCSAAMPIIDEVPREFDKIQVRFRMDSGEIVWWPTTVLTSRECQVPATVKGTARIEYAAFRSTRRSAEDVQFLADRTVNTSVGETRGGRLPKLPTPAGR